MPKHIEEDSKIAEFKQFKIQLRHMFGNKKKSTHYFETELGMIEEGKWKRKIKDLIKKYGEEEILKQLKKYCMNELAWLRYENFCQDIENEETRQARYKERIEDEALEMHASRIFKSDSWVGRELFEKVYMRNEQYQTTMF